jgi:starch phosphorylase
MPQITKFTVVPRLPERISKLLDIANNLWWAWSHDSHELFFRIDRELWQRTNQNPRQLLGEVSQLRLEEIANDDSFLAHLDRVSDSLEKYLKGNHWVDRNPDAPKGLSVAYFSAEFGIHESLRIYSGGLGVLAGDHLKAASDLALPLLGIGLLYREGYFRQYLNSDGWQQEQYPKNDFHNMPIEQVRATDGTPLVIDVEYPGRNVKAYIWRLQVGRVPLFLLDTDHEENSPEDRGITAKLYGGDHETRVKQEIMLGMGGVIALHAMGFNPSTYHMNEGHSAFMALQRIKDLMHREGLTFDQSIETVKAGSVFTTHTPVPAGNETFGAEVITHYFGKYCSDVGISIEHLLELGRQTPSNKNEPFSMTVLALRLSAGANGVSKLHGEVAREMWNETWKGLPTNEVPITSITNGIHARTWISHDLGDLFDRYMGPGWVNNPGDQQIWQRIHEVPDTELWRTHERRRERLVDFARKRLYKQYHARGANASELRVCLEVLDPEVLTIGFARRFATYKRGNLFLRDMERIKQIILNAKTPVQFILAGKAHPADTQGKQIIREIIRAARDPELRHRLVFIEDYDMCVARYLVQGVDCWLNTPRRPMEASGTSGMKAAVNGALNISIPDGWWCEAENLGPNGWSIGKGEDYENLDEQDAVESAALYEILESEVSPLFYKKGMDGLPREWIERMKSSIGTIGPMFNTYRMVQDYTDRFYVPCARRKLALIDNHRARALKLAAWKAHVRNEWGRVHVVSVESGPTEGLPVGASLPVTAEFHLAGLTAKDVLAEIYFGELDMHGNIINARIAELSVVKDLGGGNFRFEGSIQCEKTGQLGFTVRIVPNHPDLFNKHETTLITWG